LNISNPLRTLIANSELLSYKHMNETTSEFKIKGEFERVTTEPHTTLTTVI